MNKIWHRFPHILISLSVIRYLIQRSIKQRKLFHVNTFFNECEIPFVNAQVTCRMA
jgi:hypothetical protein